MGLNYSAYRYAPCVICKTNAENGIKKPVKSGRCWLRNVGDLCSYHYAVLTSTKADKGGSLP